MTALWLQEAADRFWADAGGAPAGFPRELRRAIALALPLFVVDLPRLRVAAIDAWLRERGLALHLAARDRAVRACLLARAGAGMVFLDGADPEDEQRYSLAHEVAHFLIEYQRPRERARARLGPSIEPILDGRRSPSPQERADALLAGVPLALTLHLLERTPDGLPSTAHISIAERRADALALELLAPAEAVRARFPGEATRSEVAQILRTTFGLPTTAASAYACQLAPDEGGRRSLARLLRVTRES